MFHANGWTFTWTVTAVGGLHVCLRKVDPRLAFESIEREQITTMCAAPTVLIALANAPEEFRRGVRRGVRCRHCRSSPGGRDDSAYGR